eukprot:Gregarina_sp_Poly_1__2540@NODE_168_length_12074_cov_98_169901_g149_i0_p4_GENE_NODE_168_length_12074_cov_98_169901_g149_i0NODE_168_length_12074_cov_98_169901_g149_i0_p4_ORF_typecomplete_len297_score31_53Peptidase_M50/PF02163_22/0_0003Peptidase_M50/PF02163_22/0_0099DUF1129/PF06570_11/0_51DUF1129/PF06570_11/1_9e02_NODE_168_length_12074_cov_98_169901_g149_i054596349
MPDVHDFSEMQRRLYSQDLENGPNRYATQSPRKRKAISIVFLLALTFFIAWSIVGFFVSAPFLLWLIVVSGWILSLALHEYGHAVVAYKGGDQSILDKGYLSLNFLLYMDPIMSILLPVLMLILGGIPLPGGSVLVTTSNLRSAHWDAATSLAGPTMNILFAWLLRLKLLSIGFFSTLLFKDDYNYHGCTGAAFTVLIYLQAVAALLNLLPLPPLDGWGIVSPYLSPSCFAKAWLRRSHWNYQTMSLVTFGIIFIAGSLTPVFDMLHHPIQTVFRLDRSLLTSGFASFFSAMRGGF